jgi:hypothetical protein
MANEIAGFGGLIFFFRGSDHQLFIYIYLLIILSKLTLKMCNRVW